MLGQRLRFGWDVLYIGLGRELCGATMHGLARDLGCSATKARRLYAFHRAELEEQTSYATVAVDLAQREIEAQERVGTLRATHRPTGCAATNLVR